MFLQQRISFISLLSTSSYLKGNFSYLQFVALLLLRVVSVLFPNLFFCILYGMVFFKFLPAKANANKYDRWSLDISDRHILTVFIFNNYVVFFEQLYYYIINLVDKIDFICLYYLIIGFFFTYSLNKSMGSETRFRNLRLYFLTYNDESIIF